MLGCVRGGGNDEYSAIQRRRQRREEVYRGTMPGEESMALKRIVVSADGFGAEATMATGVPELLLSSRQRLQCGSDSALAQGQRAGDRPRGMQQASLAQLVAAIPAARSHSFYGKAEINGVGRSDDVNGCFMCDVGSHH